VAEEEQVQEPEEEEEPSRRHTYHDPPSNVTPVSSPVSKPRGPVAMVALPPARALARFSESSRAFRTDGSALVGAGGGGGGSGGSGGGVGILGGLNGPKHIVRSPADMGQSHAWLA